MIALLLAVTIAAAAPFPAGKLCIADLPCIATEGQQVQIASAPEPRRFVWIADDRSIVAIGTIEPTTTTVTLDGETSRPLRLLGTVQSEIAFEIASPTARWQWTIAKPPPSIRLIHPPCADCMLTEEAKGFRKFEQPLRDVRDVVLHPWPHVRGQVIDRANNAPLAGATITVDGILLAKTDAKGHFDATIEMRWPRAIDVQFPGRAPRRVAVPRAYSDAELPAIALSAGGALRVTIETPVAEKLTWELHDPESGDLLRQGTIEPSATLVVVDGIGDGKQSFVIRGERPLQRIGTFIDVQPEQVTETSVAIEKSILHLEVKRGAEPFAHAKANVGVHNRWNGELVLDEDGRATEELWQRGKISVKFYGNDRNVYFDEKDVDSEEETWQIVVPNRRVVGRVTDATTGAPLTGAQVTLSFRFQDAPKAGMVMAICDAHGRFAFHGIPDGTQELMAGREGYQPARDLTIDVGEADGDYTLDIQLRSRNIGRSLVVTDDHGFPVASAVVIVASANGVREVGATSADGTASLPLGLTERDMVFVMPRSGSFGFARVGLREDAVALQMPASSATIEVTAHDPDGKPLANVLLVPRVDGLMLPLEVVEAFHNVQGVSFFTDAAGRARLSGLPRGTYELWAVTGRDTMRAVRSATPPPPAASLEVVSGVYTVTIGFASSSAE